MPQRLLLLIFVLGHLLSATKIHAEWSQLDERQLFDAADKVLIGKVIHYGAEEAAPNSSPTKRFRYQALWVEEGTIYKGSAHPPRFGYEVVLLPIRYKHHGPEHMLDALANQTNLPRDAEVLFFLKPDQAGAWTLVKGQQGMILDPGSTRKANLKRWSKEPAGKKK